MSVFTKLRGWRRRGKSTVDDRARRRRRRGIAAAVVGAVALLVAANTVAVEFDSAEASGDSIVNLDGGDLHVAQDGPRNGPALVLIHGLAGSANWWDSVVPKLAESHRVIRVDLLGHGRSAKPTGPGYRIPEQARRVGATLDKLDVTKATVVGHSSGGSVATALAEQRGDIVTALALINSGPSLDAFTSEGIAVQALTTPVVGHLLWRLRTDGLLRDSMRSAFTRSIEIPQQLVDDASGMTYHAFTATNQAVDDYLSQRTLPDRLAGVNKPLLVIFGKDDKRWRSASAADYRTVPDAKVEMLPGIGHSPMLEDPSRTAELLLSFTASRGG